MPWRVHDEIVRIDPRVRYLVPHASEAALFRFLKDHVRPGDVILDIGSFVGIYAILESRFAGSRGRVVAIEPTSASASVARRHFEFNASPAVAPIVLVESALGEARGEATFYQYDEPYVNALAPAVDVNGRPVTSIVEVLTIDDLCAQMKLRPTFIRMDVQGAELQVFRGARRTIASAGSALTIVAEMHPQCWPSFGVDAAQASELFATLGLSAESLEPGEDLFARDRHIVLRPTA
jgi:FkbM family methyltransferase